jgi:Ca2+/Na+ antiporter
VSVLAALRGNSDIALGNVVGSNIFNVLAILGIAALIVPLRVSAQLVRIDVPLMIAVSIVLPLLALDGTLGLRGWQWLFLIEGIPAVLLGALTPFWLTDRPEHAEWLTDTERQSLAHELAAEQRQRDSQHPASPLAALKSGRVLALCLVYFMNTMATYGIFLWLPRMLEDASGETGLRLALLTAAPLVVALVAMVLIGASSDRSGERKWHTIACALTGAAGLVVAASFQQNLLGLMLGFTLCQVGQRSVAAVFWAIPPALLGGTAAAAGIALINSLGNLGGQLGPVILDVFTLPGGSFSNGLLVLSALLVVCGGCAVFIRARRWAAPEQAAEQPFAASEPSVGAVRR